MEESVIVVPQISANANIKRVGAAATLGRETANKYAHENEQKKRRDSSHVQNNHSLGQPRQRQVHVLLHPGQGADPRQTESHHHQRRPRHPHAPGVAPGAGRRGRSLHRAGIKQRGDRHVPDSKPCDRAEELPIHRPDGIQCR